MGNTKPKTSTNSTTTKARDPKPGPAVKGAAKTSTATASAQEAHSRRAERRPDLIKKRREELRAIPDKRQKQRLYTRLGLGLLALLIVAGIGYSIFKWNHDRDLNTTPAGVVTYNYTGGQHDDNYSAWTESPPVGGVHNNVPQTCGYYAQPVGNGHAVHSLEHGAIWITYRPDLAQSQIDDLKKLAENNTYILVSPYPGLYAPVVATSWNHQLALQSATSNDLDRFIRVFKNNAKYTPEFGAVCSGTTDTVAP